MNAGNTSLPSRWHVASGAIYALFVFVVPLMSGGSPRTWLLTLASFGLFLLLYRDFFIHAGASVRHRVVDLSLMALVGFVTIPLNAGATVYVILAAVLTPLVLSPRRSVAAFIVLIAVLWLDLWLFPLPDSVVIGGWVTAIIVIAGGGNLFMSDRSRQLVMIRRVQEEVEEMAKVAERERIARDLHDLLGHTLSIIVLKAELASKLADQDVARAVSEIREVERISRDTLAEVRAAVDGMKDRGFARELRTARESLASARVRLNAEVNSVTLSAKQEATLALVLRESVTNVIRHARASECRVFVGNEGKDILMTIQDDGVGGPVHEGHGLSGMRARVRAAGGTLKLDATAGVSVSVRFSEGLVG